MTRTSSCRAVAILLLGALSTLSAGCSLGLDRMGTMAGGGLTATLEASQSSSTRRAEEAFECHGPRSPSATFSRRPAPGRVRPLEGLEVSDPEYTILRSAGSQDDEVTYQITQEGEPFKGHDVSLDSLSDLLVKLTLDPDLEVHTASG